MSVNRIWVDAWSPEYGSSARMDDGLAATEEQVDLFVEGREWRPVVPAPSERPVVAFVDGVNRVDARAFLGEHGRVVPGLFGSVGAGAVVVDGSARFSHCSVERWSVFGMGAAPVVRPLDSTLSYLGRSVPGGAPEDLLNELQKARANLEQDLARNLARGGYLVLADGPLQVREPLDLVGYIKSHRKTYLAPAQEEVAFELEQGQRTPIFQFGRIRPRYSWYARIAGPANQHPWAAIARCEVSVTVGLERAIGLADQVTHHLPRFGSKGFWDTRAPQNLVPIASLERKLWNLLGDRELILRRIRSGVGTYA
ncbi:MAG: hypothetical protein ACT4OM_03860 [Actinomycetota bacterium]